MNIIADAENHLREVKNQRYQLDMSQDFAIRRSSRILKPLEISEEDQDILGIKSPMPKIDENESLDKLLVTEDELMNQYIMYQSPNSDFIDKYERLYSQDLLKSIYDAFPNSNIPVIDIDTYFVEKALEEGRSTQLTVGSTWVNLEHENNSKNTYIKNRMTTKRLQKNIQLISKQSSKVAQQRLMKSVNDATFKNRHMSQQTHLDCQQQYKQPSAAYESQNKQARKVLDEQQRMPTKHLSGDMLGSTMTVQAYSAQNNNQSMTQEYQ